MSNAHRWRSSKKTLGHSTRKNKSNYLEPHFPTSATKSRSLEDTKTAVALPHCSESTRDSIAGWWTFRLDMTPELWRNYGTSYVKKTEVEVLPVVDLSRKSASQIVFCGRCNTRGNTIFSPWLRLSTLPLYRNATSGGWKANTPWVDILFCRSMIHPCIQKYYEKHVPHTYYMLKVVYLAPRFTN